MVRYYVVTIKEEYECHMCGKKCIPKWCIDFPYDIYCSEYCRERREKLIANPPMVGEETLQFWIRALRIKKKHQGFALISSSGNEGALNRTGSEAQAEKNRLKSWSAGGSTKTGSSPRRGDEPLSRDPFFQKKLEPVRGEKKHSPVEMKVSSFRGSKT